ncbi:MULTISPECIES: HNH endonuclease [Streptomyces]|uniref:HNH endonuclease n=1 Tax=Streptomyces TaxID=1883 RepID=UPI0036472345
MIWEWLAVLTANDGACVYCGDPSQTMDHVIPFADGGADELTNLVPVCHTCNRSKSGKSVPAWMMAMDLTVRWYGGGTPQGKSGFGDSQWSLREMYLSIHQEVLTLLDDLDTVAAEIADAQRLAWFERRFANRGFPSASLGVPRARRYAEDDIALAKKRNWPSASDDLERYAGRFPELKRALDLVNEKLA